MIKSNCLTFNELYLFIYFGVHCRHILPLTVLLHNLSRASSLANWLKWK